MSEPNAQLWAVIELFGHQVREPTAKARGLEPKGLKP